MPHKLPFESKASPPILTYGSSGWFGRAVSKIKEKSAAKAKPVKSAKELREELLKLDKRAKNFFKRQFGLDSEEHYGEIARRLRVKNKK